ncbi:hypothetical protein CapIbe_019565 [Capra ibex]
MRKMELKIGIPQGEFSSIAAAGTPTPPPPTPAPALSRAEDPRQAGSLFRQLVDDEKDWATPSLFKLGWLSSMTK